jgi:pSer/pThr/pTyr-binding forkhead associated (FHA) protein
MARARRKGLTHMPTTTDPAAGDWPVNDAVGRLREWGTDIVHPLPRPPTDECTIGSADACTLQLRDRTGRVSRLHGRLIRTQNKWLLRDEGSKNGVWVDGSRRPEVLLEPGFEIGIGGITLLPESERSIALRGFLARLVGWGSERTESVDYALRSVRMAATQRTALVLCGDGDLVSIARSLHRQSRGNDRPFIVCDPRRPSSKATVRSAENCATGMEALAAAAGGGSVCVRVRRTPPDFYQLLEALCEPKSRVQLIVCAKTLAECQRCRVMPIVFPPFSDRTTEIDRIIDEYAQDAIAELGAPRSMFLQVDHAWVRKHAATSLPEIEKATLRLVALRASRNVSDAAERLGMARVSLSRWIGRRDMPMDILQ